MAKNYVYKINRNVQHAYSVQNTMCNRRLNAGFARKGPVISLDRCRISRIPGIQIKPGKRESYFLFL